MRTTKRSTIIAVIIVAVIAIVGIFGITSSMQGREASSTRNFVNVPTVSTKVYANDGEPHDIDVDFTVEVSDDLKDVVMGNALYSRITEIVSDLNYEKIRSEGNIDYIIDEVKNNLDGIVPEDKLKEVYISSIVIDFPAERFKTESDSSTDGNHGWNRLFNNMDN